jgi:imidazolonepropionase-like amidohydrolase
MRQLFLLLLFTSCGVSQHAWGQATFPRNGVYDERPNLVAFTNAILYPDYQTRLDQATLIIRQGKVEAAGKGLAIPAGAVVIDLKGKHIYPGFVDIFSDYGMPAVTKAQVSYSSPPQSESKKQGAYGWNQAIRPETNAAELFKVNEKKAEEYRKLGFGSVLALHPDGIARGTAALVSLASKRENEVLLLDRAAAALSFDRGSSTQDYPNSQMGAIALLRQTYLDARWNSLNPNREQNLSLKAFHEARNLPQIFEVANKLEALRADKVGDEFSHQYIIKGQGDEYQLPDQIKKTGAPVIVSLNFPEAYHVEDPYDAQRVSISQLKHWEMAPANPALLVKAGIPVALTAADLKDKKNFLPNLRKAIRYGLDEQEALKALTHTPAHLIKAGHLVGSLKKGMEANFIISSGPLFAEESVLLENWVQGERYKLSEVPADVRGVYALQVGQLPEMKLEIGGTPARPDVKVVVRDTVKVKARFALHGDLITLSFPPDAGKKQENVRLSGWYKEDKAFQGEGEMPDAGNVKWSASFSKAWSEQARRDSVKAKEPVVLGELIYPFTAFGAPELPRQETVLIRNATVWTNEQEGKLTETDVLLRNGKIEKIGKNLPTAGVKVIDGTGKHLTPGIIDEHSHIALDGVNEGTQAVTAEVRMADVVNSESIHIYRQLAGGVTASQLLHGSANPIGGQSALIKLRWGKGPEQLLIEGADPFIKFALGENVKHSNRSNLHSVRFPQTRMGVEQVYVDAFQRAKEYEKAHQAYQALSKKARAKAEAPRRDLELEALLEILRGKRFITCHSYVQSEINMMIKVAEQMGFKVNTFTHILEGYKVADKMKAHGAGGSTFSDWWAYKMEVKDAIPFNAALMYRLGVTTAINSDDAEMARRLNQEAAKMVKYGGISEEDALKAVTLNPAKLLHLDHRMGSLKPGKDADVVLWSDHPLSVYAKPEKTFVDGVPYFDLERDQSLREELRQERQRLIQKMLADKGEKVPVPASSAAKSSVLHCEDVENGELEGLLEY